MGDAAGGAGSASDLASQLADVIGAGLAARPDLRQSLADSLVQDKGTKAEADYREADTDERCESCRHFEPTPSGDVGESGFCVLVSGSINPLYVCDWWDGGNGGGSADNVGDKQARPPSDSPGSRSGGGDHGDGPPE